MHVYTTTLLFSVLATIAVDFVRAMLSLRFAAFVAVYAEFLIRHFRMAFCRASMHIVTGQTGHGIAAVNDHVADIVQNMAVSWIDSRIIGEREIEMKILEQIVAGHEVVGIGQPA